MFDVDFEVIVNEQLIRGSVYLEVNHTLSQAEIDALVQNKANEIYEAEYGNRD